MKTVFEVVPRPVIGRVWPNGNRRSLLVFSEPDFWMECEGCLDAVARIPSGCTVKTEPIQFGEVDEFLIYAEFNWRG